MLISKEGLVMAMLRTSVGMLLPELVPDGEILVAPSVGESTDNIGPEPIGDDVVVGVGGDERELKNASRAHFF